MSFEPHSDNLNHPFLRRSHKRLIKAMSIFPPQALNYDSDSEQKLLHTAGAAPKRYSSNQEYLLKFLIRPKYPADLKSFKLWVFLAASLRSSQSESGTEKL